MLDQDGDGLRVAVARSDSRDLFGMIERGASLFEGLILKKADDGSPRARSRQGLQEGEIDPNYDVSAALDLRTANPWHSRCVGATRDAMVGMGFESEKIAEVLDPLCDISVQAVMEETADDFANLHMGAWEVVRDSSSEPPRGIHSIAIDSLRRVYSREGDFFYYRIDNPDSDIPEVLFAPFGKREEFLATVQVEDPEAVSEVIFFRKPSSKDRYYGYPDWVSTVAFIELCQMYVQQRFDFYHNGAVPSFLLAFLGGSPMDKQSWEKVQGMIRATTGTGNHYKALALELEGDKTVELLKLAMEAADGGSDMSAVMDPLALAIVSAHGVPPLLAGIQIPGKLGASNELPNALKAFQLLRIGPMQYTLASTLACTLGNPKINGGLGLTRKDFLPDPKEPSPGMPKQRSTGFVKITDQISMQEVSVTSQMRQTVEEANQQGRKVSDGLKA